MRLIPVTPLVGVDDRTVNYIVPSNVTMLRPVFRFERKHGELCVETEGEREECGLDKETNDTGCVEEVVETKTEILFVNTVGPHSSLIVHEELAWVVRQINDALLRS